MQNIESRMNMIEAKFDFDSAINNGFQFNMNFQLKPLLSE